MLHIRFLFGEYITEWINCELLNTKMCEILSKYYIKNYGSYNVEYRTL